MAIIFDLVDPTELVGYSRQYADEVLANVFVGQNLLPNRAVDDIEYALRRVSRRDVDIAKYRPWDTPAPMTGRPGITRLRGEIAPVSRQIALSEEEGLRLRALESAAGGKELVDTIFDDTELMIRAVEARIEVARFDALVDGILTLEENGLHLVVDYDMPATHKITAGTPWTVANALTATPISDLLAAVERYSDDNGGNMPGKIVMSRKRLPGLQVNAEVLAFAASGGTTPRRVDLATINGVLADQDLPQIEFYDVKVRDLGVQKRVLGTEYVLLLPDEKFGETLYGPTAEATLLAEKKYLKTKDVSGVCAVVTQNDHPVQTFTVGTGVALPVIADANELMTLKVAPTTTDTVIPQF